MLVVDMALLPVAGDARRVLGVRPLIRCDANEFRRVNDVALAFDDQLASKI